MASTASANNTTSGKTQKQLQSLVDGLNVLRQEQRKLSTKVIDIEGDQREHRYYNRYTL